IDSKHPATFFAADNDDGIFKSTDGGNTWNHKGADFPSSVAIDPNNSLIVYATDYADGLLRSTDGGETWKQYGDLNSSLGNPVVAVAPTNPSRVYVGTENSGIYRETDPGEFSLNFTVEAGVHAIAFDPTAPTTAYAGGHTGVYKSTDDGNHWTQMNTGLTTQAVESLAVDPQTPS